MVSQVYCYRFQLPAAGCRLPAIGYRPSAIDYRPDYGYFGTGVYPAPPHGLVIVVV